MSTTLTVPAGFVSYLRSGLFGEWGRAAADLADMAETIGSRASDGVYGELLQTFFTIYILLGEVGLKDNDTQGDVVIKFGGDNTYVINGLKDEHRLLAQQLEQLPKKTRKEMREAEASKVAEFGEFVKDVEAKANRLNGCQHKPSASRAKHVRPSRRARSSQVRRPRY